MRVALLVCSIIGFVLSIPGALCFFALGAASSYISSAGSDIFSMAGEEGEQAAEAASGILGFITAGGWIVGLIFSVLSVAAFVFAILAYVKPKTGLSLIGGIILIVAAAFMILTGWSSVVGLIAGILYLLAGIFAFIAKPAAPAGAAPTA
jgi:hypothetical protein